MSRPIFIIEDNEIVCAGLASALQAHGYETVTAANGRDGLAMLHAGLHPALILLDMILPELDGWQFCAHYMESESGVAPVVIITGLGIASVEWARSMGAVALLRKPVDTFQLLATVRSLSAAEVQ
jgi:CheY-like chemotaxis protein